MSQHDDTTVLDNDDKEYQEQVDHKFDDVGEKELDEQCVAALKIDDQLTTI